MHNFTKKLLILFACVSILASCIGNDENENSVVFSDGYMKINLNMPDLRPADAQGVGTRAMNEVAEAAINQNKLSVLVFKYTSTSEIFYYKAPLSGTIVYDSASKATITVKLVKGSASDQFRIMIVANHDLSGITMTENSTTKASIVSQLQYNSSAEWNADAANYTPFPMWGEAAPMTITASTSSQTLDVNLYRSVARLDIGLNFIAQDGKLTENATGVDGFKIKETRIYRTYDKGYVAPLNSTVSTTTADVPATAQRRADNNPLIYTSATPVDNYVREIYLPEANVPVSANNDNMHCVIVGGYYRDSPTVSYYRLDFATETFTTNRAFKPILRNHRYVFNITKVTGPGFTDPADALASTGSIVEYDVISWDENIHNLEVKGKYYFGLDERDLMLTANSTDAEPTNNRVINWQTNMPDTPSVTLSWQNPSPVFQAELMANKKIKITATADNTTNAVISDVLIVKCGLFTMKVNVRQQYVNFKYTLNCSTVKVVGTYVPGRTLAAGNTTNYIELSFTAEDLSLNNKPYIIETVDIEGGHGDLKFYNTGLFALSAGNMSKTIRLVATGTIPPTVKSAFKLRIKSNSSSSSYCEATITVVIPRMTILTLGLIPTYAPIATTFPSVLGSDRGVSLVLAAPNNFGPNDESIVKIEGFTFIDGGDVNSNSSLAYQWLTGSSSANGNKIADIVHIGYTANPGTVGVQNLIAFLNKGGVIVGCIEDQAGIRDLTRAILNNQTIMSGGRNPGGAVCPFPANPVYGTGDTQDIILRKYAADPIMNGPFGDIRDKQWGEDAGPTAYLTNLPLSDTSLTVYSKSRDILGTNAYDNEVTSYKYESKTRNIVWFGDGGFISTLNSTSSATDFPYYPFAWNTTTGFPVARTGFGHALPRASVYNSTAYCNAMAWAVYRSQFLKAQ